MKPMLNNTFLNSSELPEFRSKSQALYFALNQYYGSSSDVDVAKMAKGVYDMILRELPSLPEFIDDKKQDQTKDVIDHTLAAVERLSKLCNNTADTEKNCDHA